MTTLLELLPPWTGTQWTALVLAYLLAGSILGALLIRISRWADPHASVTTLKFQKLVLLWPFWAVVFVGLVLLTPFTALCEYLAGGKR